MTIGLAFTFLVILFTDTDNSLVVYLLKTMKTLKENHVVVYLYVVVVTVYPALSKLY